MSQLTRRATLTAALLAAPAILRAQPAPVKLGILQPVTGALAQDGDLGRLGAQIAIDDVNAAGGIPGLGGAKLEMVFGDARSTPDAGPQQGRPGMACPTWSMSGCPTAS